MKIHNKWFQLIASLIAMIMIANLQYAWTLFVKPLQAGSGWKLSDIQLAFTLFILFQTWVQPFDGWLIDRLGPRGFISAAGLLCGIGWAGLAFATSLPLLYGLYCVAGVGAAFVYSASMGSALKWFKDRRGLASGIMAAGFGGGTALFIPLISLLLKTQGYRATFVATGAVQGLVILIVAQFLRHPAREPQSAGAASKSSAGPQLNTMEMLRTSRFYIMYVMFVLMATGGLLVTASAGPMARSWGLSAGALTLATTLSPLANGTSRVFWGWVSDRIGRETAMTIAFLLHSVCLGLVVLLGERSGGWFAFSLVLVYLTWGEIYALFASAVGDYFGTRHATSNYSVLYTAKGVASIIGGWFGAFLFEQTGTWSVGFFGSALMALTAAIMAMSLRRSRLLPERRPSGVPVTVK